MLDLSDDPVTRAFKPMLGLPAWGGMKGQGSMMSFEFGAPRLTIREPYRSECPSVEVRKSAARRHVRPRGEWFLFVCSCEWRVLSGEEQVASSASEASAIEQAVRDLDGQKLIAVEVNPVDGTSQFRFDLGGALSTWPAGGETDEQWCLHMRHGQAFGYRGDGHYCHGPANQPPECERWTALPRHPLRCALP